MWCVLPLKPTRLAKQRLSKFLTLKERNELVEVMAEDVIRALIESSKIDNILVTSTETYAAKLAEKYQLPYLDSKDDKDLNSAIQAAANYLEQQNVQSMLVIHGDLPQVTARDIDHIANAHNMSVADFDSAITLVPDELGQGSNGLCCTPPTAIPFSYGVNSLVKHKYSAINNAISFQICFAESMARDIDLPEDLAQLLVTSKYKSKSNSLTVNYLNNAGIAERLIPIIQAPVRFAQPDLEEYKSARIQLMV